MNLLSHITDQDINENFRSKSQDKWWARIAVRGVLINEDEEIALMHIKKYNSYKLPGGGVDKEERLDQAFLREMLEETGYNVRKGADIGVVVEERRQVPFIQISFCYLAKPLEFQGADLTKEEEEKGFELIWVKNINKAVELVTQSYKDVADAKFMSLRDESILQKAKEIIQK